MTLWFLLRIGVLKHDIKAPRQIPHMHSQLQSEHGLWASKLKNYCRYGVNSSARNPNVFTPATRYSKNWKERWGKQPIDPLFAGGGERGSSPVWPTPASRGANGSLSMHSRSLYTGNINIFHPGSLLLSAGIKIPGQTNHQQDCRVTSLGVWVVLLLWPCGYHHLLHSSPSLFILFRVGNTNSNHYDGIPVLLECASYLLETNQIHRVHWSLLCRLRNFFLDDCNSQHFIGYFLPAQNLINKKKLLPKSWKILCVWQTHKNEWIPLNEEILLRTNHLFVKRFKTSDQQPLASRFLWPSKTRKPRLLE